jgi:DNA-binding MarR family transcriptional regulator
MTPERASRKNQETMQSVLDSLRRIVRALRISSRSSEKTHGLSAAQLFVMNQLARALRPLSMNELAQATFTHQSSVSAVVSRLVDRRLVQRVTSEKDARKVEVFLTDEGSRLVENSPRAVQDQLVLAIEKLGPERSQELAVLLNELVVLAGYEQGEVGMFDMVD